MPAVLLSPLLLCCPLCQHLHDLHDVLLPSLLLLLPPSTSACIFLRCFVFKEGGGGKACGSTGAGARFFWLENQRRKYCIMFIFAWIDSCSLVSCRDCYPYQTPIVHFSTQLEKCKNATTCRFTITMNVHFQYSKRALFKASNLHI